MAMLCLPLLTQPWRQSNILSQDRHPSKLTPTVQNLENNKIQLIWQVSYPVSFPLLIKKKSEKNKKWKKKSRYFHPILQWLRKHFYRLLRALKMLFLSQASMMTLKKRSWLSSIIELSTVEGHVTSMMVKLSHVRFSRFLLASKAMTNFWKTAA